MKRLLVMAGMVAVVSCGGKSATAPVVTNVSGNWSGPVFDALLGNGTLSLSMIQAGNDSLSGTWATTFSNAGYDLSGNILGTVSGSTFSVILKPANPPTCQYGPYRFTAALTGTTSISGTFASAYSCVVLDSGTFSVSRQ